MREIKFDFIYELIKKDKTKFYLHRQYTLDEIMANMPQRISTIIADYPECISYSLIAKRQFTGLLDKNGREIYKGDIQKLTFGDHYWIYVVKSIGGQFGNQLFSMTIKDNMSVDEEKDIYTFQERVLDIEIRNYVKSGKYVDVIGNIYENPELLEN